jgi:hypothetical protein
MVPASTDNRSPRSSQSHHFGVNSKTPTAHDYIPLIDRIYIWVVVGRKKDTHAMSKFMCNNRLPL